jgi:hypothetical protein
MQTHKIICIYTFIFNNNNDNYHNHCTHEYYACTYMYISYTILHKLDEYHIYIYIYLSLYIYIHIYMYIPIDRTLSYVKIASSLLVMVIIAPDSSIIPRMVTPPLPGRDSIEYICKYVYIYMYTHIHIYNGLFNMNRPYHQGCMYIWIGQRNSIIEMLFVYIHVQT